MEYKRKEAEMPGRKIGEKASKLDSLKEDIIDMVIRINNQDYLFKIYHYILAKYRRDKEQAGD